MSIPWESPTFTAESMQPDVPVPVVARNPKTGKQVRVDVSNDLRLAIKRAINDAVLDSKPALAHVITKPGDLQVGYATDRTLLQGAAIDLVAFTVAGIATYLSPQGDFATFAWVVAASLAAKTMIQVGVSFATKATGGAS
jgi:hypothetical protein